jgi:protein ImuA
MGSLTTPPIHRLADRIRAIEAERPHFQTTLSLGLPPLEEMFPERRLPAGSLMELLTAAPGGGAWTLALLMAKHACGTHRTLVVADVERHFYPPGAAALGVDLARTIVVRPRTRQKALLAVTQALRCPAIGAVIARFEQLPAVDFRRLQLAAETGGGAGFLLRPLTALRTSSFAAVRLVIAPVVSVQEDRVVQVEVARLRGGKSGQAFFVEIDHETGHVSVPAPVAAAKSGTQSAKPRSELHLPCPTVKRG